MKSGIDRIGRTVTVETAMRGCLEKLRFNSKNIARDRIAAYVRTHPEWPDKRAYRCTLCGGWHLTTIKTAFPPTRAST